MPKHPSQILELARKGAEVRYQELKSEIASLVRYFPHLHERGAGQSGRFKPGKNLAPAASDSAPIRKRSKMSATARKAVSLRMKKYWAERRAAKTKKK
jgi:hypothetical protein